jgi:hypothetical protein
LKWRPEFSEGVDVETVPGGLITPEGWEIEEIWVKLSFGPDFFFKNQEGKFSG